MEVYRVVESCVNMALLLMYCRGLAWGGVLRVQIGGLIMVCYFHLEGEKSLQLHMLLLSDPESLLLYKVHNASIWSRQGC